jgi:hypothetical protein
MNSKNEWLAFIFNQGSKTRLLARIAQRAAVSYRVFFLSTNITQGAIFVSITHSNGSSLRPRGL